VVKILAVSDVELPQLQNAAFLRKTYSDVDLLISCGDMSVSYLDFIGSVLTLPLFFVRGNHDTEYVPPRPGGDNLHLQFTHYRGYTFVGLEGSIRYNRGTAQYTQSEMFVNVLRLLPRMVLRRFLTGHGVDVVVTHSPPWRIHDLPDDYAHRGFRAFRLLMRAGQPLCLLHGHVDTWDRRRPRRTVFGKTTVLNINPYMVVDLSDYQRRK